MIKELFGFREKTTAELVMPFVQDVVPDIPADEREHFYKLQKLTHHPFHIKKPNTGLDNKIVEKLKAENFRAFVPSSIANKFKYAAAVNNHKDRFDSPVREDEEFDAIGHIEYIGDIPDWAIDRASAALKCGIKYLTIHSTEKFPVKVVHVDPVIIGWTSNPDICEVTGGFRAFTETTGVIVAIWGYDLEAVVLG